MATRGVHPDSRYWLSLRTVVDECSLDARLVEGDDLVAVFDAQPFRNPFYDPGRY